MSPGEAKTKDDGKKKFLTAVKEFSLNYRYVRRDTHVMLLLLPRRAMRKDERYMRLTQC